MRKSRSGLPVASSLCPVFFGEGCWTWWAISGPPLLPPQNLWSARPSCEAGLWHFAATGLWMFRIVCLYFQGYSLKTEGADSKEFRGQAATASSFGGLLLSLYIPYLDSHGASVFLTFVSLVRCFQVGFSVRNLHRRGVYMKWWVSKVCLIHGTSETLL